ncbi:protein enhancer of sevenless 2b [Anaeramoeba flamelloides]|uniref:Protein enhancer of sevenless 2b n=1 Tax=Anaeramoeba flamelloides TaxID=1746091 RepID=A0AAV7ZS92_9EUKA|nr:protein enhancer of sevenless 2b [Anaeramoeba flamelloides]
MTNEKTGTETKLPSSESLISFFNNLLTVTEQLPTFEGEKGSNLDGKNLLLSLLGNEGIETIINGVESEHKIRTEIEHEKKKLTILKKIHEEDEEKQKIERKKKRMRLQRERIEKWKKEIESKEEENDNENENKEENTLGIEIGKEEKKEEIEQRIEDLFLEFSVDPQENQNESLKEEKIEKEDQQNREIDNEEKNQKEKVEEEENSKTKTKTKTKEEITKESILELELALSVTEELVAKNSKKNTTNSKKKNSGTDVMDYVLQKDTPTSYLKIFQSQLYRNLCILHSGSETVDKKYAVATTDFESQNSSYLSFKKGQVIKIFEIKKGMLRKNDWVGELGGIKGKFNPLQTFVVNVRNFSFFFFCLFISLFCELPFWVNLYKQFAQTNTISQNQKTKCFQSPDLKCLGQVV